MRNYLIYATIFLSGIFGCVLSVQSKESVNDYHIVVTDHQCQPMSMQIFAGKSRFIIKNKSSRVLEWEILKGVRVVAERENIAPGFYQKMTVDLLPGKYAMTCGLLTNPQGQLVVKVPQGGMDYQVQSKDLIAIASEYKFKLIMRARALSKTLAREPTQLKVADSGQYQLLHLFVRKLSPSTIQNRAPASANYSHLQKQISQWQQLLLHQSMTTRDVIDVLAHAFATYTGEHAAMTQALLQGTEQFVTLIEPVMQHLNPQQLKQFKSDLSQFRTRQNQRTAQQVQRDLHQLSQSLAVGGQ
ncbi:cupredoxin domain-containing protein [Celerinatantimonas diazotrophica]|uniref:Cupredoxin-like protein n=1 Tax=Celerinatantimonas diazotrophica TaxID=412034 RepID=A0A4R1J911_9GAMM|nr:cupredoxin domain-containing protein [Celerinatantimonas diazotrophica]TCK47066.1 cupredoxin-like protein [Celerinatantimonas diazotrophica]CAG9295835.1 hypothetical protein CEDIAZO_00967 [Celerinatantimonas diazotrophica]